MLSWSPDGMLAVAYGPVPLCWAAGADTARLCLPLPSLLALADGHAVLSSPEQRAQATPDALDLLLHTDWAAVMPTRDGVYGPGDGQRGLERATRVAGRVAARDRGWLHLWQGESPTQAGWTGSVAATQALLRWTPRPGGSQLQGAHFQEVEVWLDASPAPDAPPTTDDTLPNLTSRDGWIFNAQQPLCRLMRPTACVRLPEGGWLIGDAHGALALVAPDLSLALRLRVVNEGQPHAAAVTALALRAAPQGDAALPWEFVCWFAEEPTPWAGRLPALRPSSEGGSRVVEIPIRGLLGERSTARRSGC